ncbi:MAG TPA: L,D-transpeptidase [Solirubrobacteraceae bacterium]|nr:L,D-transpeptidase [Solirubrobacteraceae bacterium]
MTAAPAWALVLVACALFAPAAAAGSAIAPEQELVVLLGGHEVRSRPDVGGAATGSIGPRRPITHARTVLPVLDRRVDDDARGWLRVRLPGRTLGRRSPPRSGWIRSNETRRATTRWHIVVDVGARGIRVYRSGRLIRRFAAIVGKPSTPTPRGRYFVEENVRLDATHAGAPFALATSARSRVLQEFAGGPGQIALHGLQNIGGRPGTAISHGCVRLRTADVTWLAARIAPGIPVTIV